MMWPAVSLAGLLLLAAPAAPQQPRTLLEHFFAQDRQGRQWKALMRVDLDVTGDGQPEVFLTGSAGWGKSGSYWTAYSCAETGFSVLGERLLFHPGFFVWRPESREIVVLQPIQISRYRLVRYRLAPQGFVESDSREVADWKDGETVEEIQRLLDEMRAFEADRGFSFVRAPVESAIRGLEGAAIDWVDVETGEPVTGLLPLDCGL